ncbi:MAG: hypothetical protein K2Y37_16320, partial [Pirellulales bacterium]|nr:hypothetical protein [Pirellulales bacterium]
DLVPEPTEEFYATITTANVTTTDWQGICTVLDDDPRINLSADVINMNVSAGVLSEALEETVGAYVPLNDDDDDYDPLHLPDKDQQDPLVFGENDLLPITLQKVDPLASGGEYTLTIPSNVRVWTHDDRSVQVTSSTTFSAAADTRLYVEGFQVGSGILRINWSNGLKTINDADRVTINVFKMNGPLNVPGYAIYEYTAFGGRPDDSGWVGSDQATTQININDDAATGLDYIDVLWGSGPYVGELAYKASTDYVWKLDVNVVEVRIKPGDADNINHMFYADAQGDANHTPPIPANPPLQIQGTAIIKSASQFGDDAMKSLITVETIAGPTVAGSERGKSFLEIGYLQTGRVGSKQAMFPSPQGIWVRRSSFAPAEAPHLESIDAAGGSTLPWYDSGNVLAGQAVPFNYPRTPHGMLSPADNVAYNDVEFWTIDNPRLMATDTPQIITPGSPLQILTASDYVVSVVFATYLGVRSKEAKPDHLGILSDTIYTQRTKAVWSFVAAGQVVGASSTSFGVWTFADGGVDGDFSPEVVTSGDRVSFTDQQPLNVLGSTTNESWTNDAP